MLRKGRKDVGWGSGGAERPGVGGRAGEHRGKSLGPKCKLGCEVGRCVQKASWQMRLVLRMKGQVHCLLTSAFQES